MRPITTDQYPLPAKRPRYPVTNKDKIKRVFGSASTDIHRAEGEGVPGQDLDRLADTAALLAGRDDEPVLERQVRHALSQSRKRARIERRAQVPSSAGARNPARKCSSPVSRT